MLFQGVIEHWKRIEKKNSLDFERRTHTKGFIQNIQTVKDNQELKTITCIYIITTVKR